MFSLMLGSFKLFFIPFILREQLDTWNILARARNEGRLFSRIEWPKDPEIVSQPERSTSACLLCLQLLSEVPLFVLAERTGETVAPPFNCKRFCRKYPKEP